MTRRSELTVIAILVLMILTVSSGERCNKDERRALLDFKAGISHNPQTIGNLSLWGQESAKGECCEWLGVKCDTKSGHVVRLDLSPTTFNWSTEDLGIYPGFLGSLRKLKYLNLSYTRISGEVPPQLGNLSALQILDLSDPIKKTISNFGWVSKLLSLQSLDLSYNDISMAKDWLDAVSNLPNLSDLRLRYSQLQYTVPRPSLPVNASGNLVYLDLSENSGLSSSIYPWLFNHSDTLVHVDLSYCYMGGSIPESFRGMAALEYLDLSKNLFQDSIPEYIGNLKVISYLSLGQNKLEGLIPENFGMSALEYLDLGENHLYGEIPKSIWRSCSLRIFYAPSNNLTGHLRFAESTSDCAHFPLEHLCLSENRIGGSLPNLTLYPSLITLKLYSKRLDGIVSESLGELSNLETLDLGGNTIKAVLTEAHFSNLFKLRSLDLSSNSDMVLNFSPDWIPSFQLWFILLRSCKLGPQFPRWLRNQKSYYEMTSPIQEFQILFPTGFGIFRRQQRD